MKTIYETSAQVIDFLKKNGKLIREDGDAALREAEQVMQVYDMYYRHPDHVTLGVLMGAMDCWRKVTKKVWSA